MEKLTVSFHTRVDIFNERGSGVKEDLHFLILRLFDEKPNK